MSMAKTYSFPQHVLSCFKDFIILQIHIIALFCCVLIRLVTTHLFIALEMRQMNALVLNFDACPMDEARHPFIH